MGSLEELEGLFNVDLPFGELCEKLLVEDDPLEECQRRKTKHRICINDNMHMEIHNIVLTLSFREEDCKKSSNNRREYVRSSSGGVADEELVNYVDLRRYTRDTRFMGTQYNPERFNAAIVREKSTSSAALNFETGRVVSTGHSHIVTAIKHLKIQCDNLVRSGLDRSFVQNGRVHIQNLVSSGCFNSNICRSVLVDKYESCHKDDSFPAVIVHSKEKFDTRVMLVFQVGKVCHSGACSPREIFNDMRAIYPMLEQCESTPQNEKLEQELSKKRGRSAKKRKTRGVGASTSNPRKKSRKNRCTRDGKREDQPTVAASLGEGEEELEETQSRRLEESDGDLDTAQDARSTLARLLKM